MSLTWVTVVVFVACTLLIVALGSVLYDLFFHYRSLVGRRLDDLSSSRAYRADPALFDLKTLRSHVADTHRTWRGWLDDVIEQGGLQVTRLQLGAVGLALGLVLAAPLALFTRWWIAPLGFVAGALLPLGYVLQQRAKWVRRLTRQLPDAFDLIGRAVRSGQTVPAAMQIVADELDAPLAWEFRRCYEQQNLGMSPDAVLRDLARRTGVMELQIFVVALLVQVRSGGNIVDLLTNLSAMVRKRLTLQQKIKSLTAEGRMQAVVLIVLPILTLGVLTVLSPDYVATLFARPWILAGTGAAQVLGAVWIRRIVALDV